MDYMDYMDYIFFIGVFLVIALVVFVVGRLIIRSGRDTDLDDALAGWREGTEMPLRYRLTSIEFIEHTRVARINFTKIRQYKTIERTIQRNHQKFNIYSGWKVKKTPLPAISLKLTNSALENLRCPDFLFDNDVVKKWDAAILVSEHAHAILSKLVRRYKAMHMMPSWVKKTMLEEECTEKVATFRLEEAECEIIIADAKDSIHGIEAETTALEKKVTRVSRARRHKILFVIFSIGTIGIYALVNSGRRQKKLFTLLDDHLQNSAIEIANLNLEITAASEKAMQIRQNVDATETDYTQRLNQVQSLEDYVADNTDFLPMQNLLGFDYEKITGVYVIRNRMLDKVYVGQSKDVLKRLKNHFAGTEPKNMIFAEDYYLAKPKDRATLFEFKIEVLKTKDELDKRERDLIAEYDSFNNGYNKTAGNI